MVNHDTKDTEDDHHPPEIEELQKEVFLQDPSGNFCVNLLGTSAPPLHFKSSVYFS